MNGNVSEARAEYRIHPRFMVVLLTGKNEEDPIKNKGDRVLTRSCIDFSDAQGQLIPQSVVESGRISNTSKLLWLSLLPAKMKKIQSKLKALECLQHFFHYKSMGFFSDAQGQLTNSAVHGRIKSKFELLRDFMVVLFTCNNEVDPNKNEGARVLTTFSLLLTYGRYLLPWKPEF